MQEKSRGAEGAGASRMSASAEDRGEKPSVYSKMEEMVLHLQILQSNHCQLQKEHYRAMQQDHSPVDQQSWEATHQRI